MPLAPQPRDWSTLAGCKAYSPLVPKMAQLLSEVSSAGDLTQHVESVFSGKASLSVMDFLHRMCKYAQTPPEALICTGLLVYRLLGRVDWNLDSQNSHRIIAAAFLVAEKTSNERFRGMSHHSKMFGIPKKELVILERALLTEVNWDVHVSSEEYAKFKRLLEVFQPRSPRSKRS
eukprot:Hpha_TRINITY_DN4892_c0_g1::TRINITY_DN4892_c0_g1_i1::g.20303::m.20303